MMKPVFVSQSAAASPRTERLQHELLERFLPAAFRAINRPDLAAGLFFDRVEQRNRMTAVIREAAEGARVGLLLHSMGWQGSDFVRRHELPLFDPVTRHLHGREAVGVMFDPSPLSPGRINTCLGLDADGAGGIQWLTFRGKAYSELGDAGRQGFALDIAGRIDALVPLRDAA